MVCKFENKAFVFENKAWSSLHENQLENYRSYPRIVGETGGKDFVMVHKSANPSEVATALVRGSFEYQGQKCSAASRAYIPASLWPEVKKIMTEQIASIKTGSPSDTSNFVNAVINERSFDKIVTYIEFAKNADDAEIICGGNYDKSIGYFISPTVIKTSNPYFKSMVEEIFGPILTLFVYEDEAFEETLSIVDNTSEYALTGSIIANDRYAIQKALLALENSAGNFYVNDKPTGAVVGQQPFGGARGSGTNDKAGAPLNLLRWVSARTIKETFVPAKDYSYPFLH
jgi:1-pyrroline-5-carboxylate dehydrogenase